MCDNCKHFSAPFVSTVTLTREAYDAIQADRIEAHRRREELQRNAEAFAQCVTDKYDPNYPDMLFISPDELKAMIKRFFDITIVFPEPKGKEKEGD